MADTQHEDRVAVGVLSDTHGQLYPEVLRSLEGVDHIIHAGDIGSARVLNTLQALAPVTAVRGNCDLESWADTLPGLAEVTLGGVRILVSHIIQVVPRPAEINRQLPTDHNAGGGGEVAAVVFGHSHLASLEERDQVLYLNPGSAGPRRFGRPRTVARFEIEVTRADESGKGSAPRLSATIVPLGG